MTVFPNHHQPALVLAPMEGVTDAPMRAVLTQRSGYSYCVSEFLRVNDLVLPEKVFRKHIPESLKGWKTAAGVDVQLQLLGGNAQVLAETAKLGVALGAKAVDLNFGCPAKTVNRHDGGASLLKYPKRILEIVAAVRKAIPASVPVSAKMRLGFDHMDAIDENAEMAAMGGASWITIHGRTKEQGYRPPAYWKPIGRIKNRLNIPVIANGEIWNLEDFKRCQDETQSQHFMIGRGALANPGLIFQIADHLRLPYQDVHQDRSRDFMKPEAWAPIFRNFIEVSKEMVEHGEGGKLQKDYPIHRYMVARLKQWLSFARIQNSIPWFDEVKRIENLDEMLHFLMARR